MPSYKGRKTLDRALNEPEFPHFPLTALPRGRFGLGYVQFVTPSGNATLSTVADILPLSETRTPQSQAELAEIVRHAYGSLTPIYPIGGGASLDFGLPARATGIGLSLANLNRVIEYPARDMTITVEAGITIAELNKTLAAEGQCLPIDVAHPELATLGGAIATNASGPRRYGFGTLRDYVIGISAVDGRGMPFKGGGRVVKNVAGYDFCKLLTGSLGTLGVITQVTLKVKPIPPRSAWLIADVSTWSQVEKLLDAVAASKTTPAAVELLAGPAWSSDAMLASSAASQAYLMVALQGTGTEVEWMTSTLTAELKPIGEPNTRIVTLDDGNQLAQRLVDFAATPGPLVLKANILPHAVVELCRHLTDIDPKCSIQSHAGNGIVFVALSEVPSSGISRTLVGKLQPLADRLGGHLTMLSTTSTEITRQSVWGGALDSTPLMDAVKKQFDPRGLLNPGRFVYSAL